MDSRVRSAVAWQVYGGIVATVAIAGAMGELLWWSLYLSDRTNVTPGWTRIVHSAGAVALCAVLFYHSQRHQRGKAMAAAGRAGLIEDRGVKFRLGSFPVTVQWVFFLLIALIGYDPEDLVRTAVFIVVATIAVLAHEGGHAVAAALANQTGIRIDLYALGGVTTFAGDSLRPAQRVAIALAGPASGAAIGVAVLAVAAVAPPFRGTTVFHDLLFVTFGWSALNLVPAWPLDGGVLLAVLVKRQWVVSTVSITIAAIGFVACARLRRTDFFMFCLALLAVNILALPTVSRALRRWDSQVG